ncbi:hypothetical protein NPX13_g9401 [Xylaria arbuscula]|uniref:Uncharacterized protein n=1 Tax=Xylaria arbuscula TaxID=114810 RepID=A0A9W8N6T2_9PEZI|nr:hypothetical protein NPX13_g9401 [Xylaria arbuscula]
MVAIRDKEDKLERGARKAVLREIDTRRHDHNDNNTLDNAAALIPELFTLGDAMDDGGGAQGNNDVPHQTTTIPPLLPFPSEIQSLVSSFADAAGMSVEELLNLIPDLPTAYHSASHNQQQPNNSN